MDAFKWFPTRPTIVEFQRFFPEGLGDGFPVMTNNKVQHPGGGHIFYDDSKHIVAPHPLRGSLIPAANQVLDHLRAGEDDVTIVINVRGSNIELGTDVDYYGVLHSAKRLVWMNDHAPPPPQNVDVSLHQDLEYWVHMGHFPAPRYSTADDLAALKRVLENNALHIIHPIQASRHGLSRPRLQPLIIQRRLYSLQQDCSGLYGTFKIANIWKTVIENQAVDLPNHPGLNATRKPNEIEDLLSQWLKYQPGNVDDEAAPAQPENGGEVEDNQRIQPPMHTHTISHTMSINEVLDILREHRCQDVTDRLDPTPLRNPALGGGFGEVFEGSFHASGSMAPISVCLKCIKPVDAHGLPRKVIKIAAHELFVWSKCEHPNILKLIGVAKFQERLAMVSPWMAHGNLRDFLAQRSPDDRYNLCMQVADGVAYMHSVGMVHGDLKCANIVVSEDGVPKITDFGTATITEYSIEFTRSGMGLGSTLRWMAPEMLDEVPKPTTQSDVYSLAMTILEAFTGHVPYMSTLYEQQVLVLIMRNIPPQRPPRDFPEHDQRANLMWRLLEDCWAFDPALRPQAAIVHNKMEQMLLIT